MTGAIANRKTRSPAALLAGALALSQIHCAAAQPAPYFSPTFAASEGSPYKDVYGQAFGAGDPPPQQPAVTAEPGRKPPLPDPGPPLETAAPPPDEEAVYVIEDGRLLTFSAEDYASGTGEAQFLSPLPAGSSPLGVPEPALPTIAGRLYGDPTAEPAAGTIPLTPPRN